ncbi:MAG: translocation protein TolB [Psychrobacter sp.]|nr:translocation protein TolB [Psychrobacter sp.]
MTQTPNKLLPSITALSMLVGGSLVALPVLTQAAEPLELEFTYVAPRQQSQVAFVPFAGDSTISPVVLSDLSKSELKATSQNLPQQPHSSGELAGTLPIWQQTAIPYLVVGGTRSNKGSVVTDYEVIDLKTGRIIGGKQTLTSKSDASSLRYAGHVIADKVYELITGIPGDFSGKIAYVEETGSAKDKTSQIKVMDADGQNSRAVTPPIKGSIFSPTWSPDARKLAFTVQTPKAYPILFIQDIDGGAPRAIAKFAGSNISPSFSPDGSSILFSSSFEGSPDIYRVSTAGGTPQKIIGTPYRDIQPSYAPDGNSFLYVSDPKGENHPQIFSYNFATGTSTPVSRTGYATSPQYNKDGTQIAFLNGRSAAIMNTAGAIVTSIGNTGIDESASFSPNGKRIIYASKQGNRGVLTIKSLNGGETFSLGGAPNTTLRAPVWSSNPK